MNVSNITNYKHKDRFIRFRYDWFDRIFFPCFMYPLAGCMGFVSMKNK